MAVKVLLVNLHSVQNAGDAALLEMALGVLRSAFPGARITLAMNACDPTVCEWVPGETGVVPSFGAHFTSVGAHRTMQWRPASIAGGLAVGLGVALVYRLRGQPPGWIPASWRELLLAYAQADLIVSCPGNIFATLGRLGVPLLVAAFTMGYGLMLGKRLYVLPQSVGPLERSWERRLVRQILSRASLVFTREPVSFRLIQELGLTGPRFRLAPDLAFAVSPAPEEEARNLLGKLVGGIDRDRPVVGVTAINRLVQHIVGEDWERYERALASALSNFVDKYAARVVFFPQVTGPAVNEDDRVAARRVAEKMARPGCVTLIEQQLSPGVLKAMYGLTDVFVATRMHSAIFAVSMGIPTLLIEYLHKARGLAEMLGLQDWTLQVSQVSEAGMWEKLDALYERRVTVHQHLVTRVPGLLEEIDAVGRALAEDFYG